MSRTLYWNKTSEGNPINSIDLRNIIEDEYGDNCILTYNHLEFLRGVSAAGVVKATELINAIIENDEIIVRIEG